MINMCSLDKNKQCICWSKGAFKTDVNGKKITFCNKNVKSLVGKIKWLIRKGK